MERTSKTRRLWQRSNKISREGTVLLVQNIKSAGLIADRKRITKAETQHFMMLFFSHTSTKRHDVHSSLLERRLQAL